MDNNIIKGITKSGFEYEIKKDSVDDIEFIEILGEVDENPLVLPKMCLKLFGKEGKKRLYDHVRNEDGIATMTKVSELLMEIIESNNALKN